MGSLRILVFASLALALVPLVSAQSLQHRHEADSGEVGQLGQVNFPVSCNAAAQQEFTRAVAMQHSFWYQRAEKAFAAVAQKETSCAMAYWGIAMSRFCQLWGRPSRVKMWEGMWSAWGASGAIFAYRRAASRALSASGG